MYQILLVIFFFIAIFLITLIMFQQVRNPALRDSFRASFSDTLFHVNHSNNFVNRMIVILATLFFIISLILSNINNKNTNGDFIKNKNSEKLNADIKSNQTKSVDLKKIIDDIPK